MYHSFCNTPIDCELAIASRITPRLLLMPIYLTKMTTYIMIFLQYGFGETLLYVYFSFVHQEVTKIVCQYIIDSMLTAHVMPVPPQ